MADVISRINLSLHVVLVLVSLSIAFALFDSSLFAWHPVFMSIGYLLFMAEGLISAVRFRHLDGAERVKAIQLHALWQIRAVVCVVLGFVVIFRNKMNHHKHHFTSTHGKLGLATVVLSIVLPLGGAISFKKLGLIYRFPEAWHAPIKALHRRAGVLTWFLALATIELALVSKTLYKGFLTQLWQVGVAAAGVLMMVFMAKNVIRMRSLDDPVSSKAV